MEDKMTNITDLNKFSEKEIATFEHAADELNRGINFDKNLALFEKEAEQNNVYALKVLGFLYSVGVFNPDDPSKSALIDISSKESEEKAKSYFKKAKDLGSVHAMLWFAMHDCIYISHATEENLEEGETLPTAQDFIAAEALALKTIEESKKESSDCPDGLIECLYYWIARLYDSKNPNNPIYDEKKAAYWDKMDKESEK